MYSFKNRPGEAINLARDRPSDELQASLAYIKAAVSHPFNE